MANTRNREPEEQTPAPVVEQEPPREKLVRIRLPLIPNVEHQEAQFVSCNGRDYVIPRGVDMEVPECIVEILRNSENAMLEAYRYEAANKRD